MDRGYDESKVAISRTWLQHAGICLFVYCTLALDTLW